MSSSLFASGFFASGSVASPSLSPLTRGSASVSDLLRSQDSQTAAPDAFAEVFAEVAARLRPADAQPTRRPADPPPPRSDPAPLPEPALPDTTPEPASSSEAAAGSQTLEAPSEAPEKPEPSPNAHGRSNHDAAKARNATRASDRAERHEREHSQAEGATAKTGETDPSEAARHHGKGEAVPSDADADETDAKAQSDTEVAEAQPAVSADALLTPPIADQQAVSAAIAVPVPPADAAPTGATEASGPKDVLAGPGRAAQVLLSLALSLSKEAAGDPASAAGSKTVSSSGAPVPAVTTAAAPDPTLAALLGTSTATPAPATTATPVPPTAEGALQVGLAKLEDALKLQPKVLAADQFALPPGLSVANDVRGTAPSLDLPRSDRATQLATTLAALPIAVGSRALAGTREFTIHLYPAELGKVEVKLEIASSGAVRAHLTVDKIDTLQLLQRDASNLQRALEQAGLKPSDQSLNFSLRQEGGQNLPQRQGQDQAAPGRVRFGGNEAGPAERDVTVGALAAYARRGNGALDIHI